MAAASYHNRSRKKHGNFSTGSLKIFDFSYLPLRKARKVGCLKISDFSESDFSYLALGKTREVVRDKLEKKSSISEVLTWPSGSAELCGRVCGGKVATPEVKWIKLFLMYLHPWSPGVPILRSQTLNISLNQYPESIVFVKSQIPN